MKRLIVFLLALTGSWFSGIYGCGPYYPFGDDIRFVLLRPELFHYSGFQGFSYSADIFYSPLSGSQTNTEGRFVDDNMILWRKRCNNVPLLSDIYQTIYGSNETLDDPAGSNSFIQYLKNHSDKEAIEYITFAKRCSRYNASIEDPWERNEFANVPQRARLINQALSKAVGMKDPDLQQRYAFLAIRLAYYNNDGSSIKNIYSTYFGQRKTKNIIDYWSMYFMTFAETDSTRRNYYASQVFSFAPDKRQNIYHYYDKEVPVEESLKYTKNKQEEAAVWMMAGFRKTGKTIDILKKLYSMEPDLQGLSFLLLREVNKLEDWIYTPYYTSFNPSLVSWDDYRNSYPASRITEDRKYAGELLTFVSSVDISKVENPGLWNIAKAYLSYMTLDYKASCNEIKELQNKKIKDQKINNWLDMLKVLCITADQKDAVIRDDVKPVIMREFAASNNKFIFALARELEYRGNTTDAAILLSKLKARTDNNYYDGYYRNGIYWRTKANHFTLYVNYYEDYFFYLDAQYSPKEVHDLIVSIEHNRGNNAFDLWEYSVIKNEIPRLYDLLGTKYLRINDLKSALTEFKNVNDTLWTSDSYSYRKYLNANPFYTNLFNEHQKTVADTVHFNKAELTSRLIDYLNKANDVTTKNRDFYYFLSANCYFNMTEYGNSWLMKRYYWSSNLHLTQLEDDDDYFNCTLAKSYYLKAKDASRSKKFAALCLRMAGRCESYKISLGRRYDYSKTERPENIYYKNLKNEFTSYYDDLMGNCESFDRYFKSVE